MVQQVKIFDIHDPNRDKGPKVVVAEGHTGLLPHELKVQGFEVVDLGTKISSQIVDSIVLDHPGTYMVCSRNGSQDQAHDLAVKLDGLGLWHTRTVGTEKLDLLGLARQGVMTINCASASAPSVTHLVVTQIGDLLRQGPRTRTANEQNRWCKELAGSFEPEGLSVGVVGFGRIGESVSKQLAAQGFQVSVYDTREARRNAGKDLGFTSASTLEELLFNADIVTLHASPEDPTNDRLNTGLIGENEINAIGKNRSAEQVGFKPPKILINAAREMLLDLDAAKGAMIEGRLTGLAIDVCEGEETNPFVSPLKELIIRGYNIIHTHHIGATTQQGQNRIQKVSAAEILDFHRKGKIDHNAFNPFKPLAGLNGNIVHHGPGITVMHSSDRGTIHAITGLLAEAGLNTRSLSTVDAARYQVGITQVSFEKVPDAQALTATLATRPDIIRSVWVHRGN